jgi:serine protease Do
MNAMTRRLLVVWASLIATVAFVVGLVVAGALMPAPATSAQPQRPSEAARRDRRPVATVPVSFADIAERLNPTVVNIEASVRGEIRSRRRFGVELPETPDLFGRLPERDLPRRGVGTGFLIDAFGHILTNDHVIEGADRIVVRLTDGRSLRAERVGSDPETDIALIKVNVSEPLPYAPLGDSDTLRVGDWVVAIGNPLAYEHTVTVGVVSFIGRKLFNTSLDRYIQTDAAISFGNSGGPLINAHGEVIGITAAVSSRAANIGFAVPINQATAILPQLRETGRVSRGYIGVAPREVDPDLRRSLGLPSSTGALVQDVTPGSPGARAGLRPYDLIVAVDGRPVADDDELIQLISSRRPGTTATLQIVRDGRAVNVSVKLAERPGREAVASRDEQPQRSSARRWMPPLGMMVADIDRELARRLNLPEGTAGVVVTRVEAMTPAFDASIARGHVVLEINRQPVRSTADYRRLTDRARSGDILTLYVLKPELGRRELHTVRVD